MKAKRIFETVLYADDLSAVEEFYGRILGMEVIQKSELFLTFRMSQSVLLIFDPTLSAESGRSVPSHGMQGEGHIAFAALDEEIDAWKVHLERAGIEIEQIHSWDEGGRSLYVRDPAGNSVEFAPGTLWGGGWKF
jgi:catechol 2,3-dioxygenase-like lactoylglutathione lyase family enzyme